MWPRLGGLGTEEPCQETSLPSIDAAEIKRNVDIVDLIGEYLQLTSRGRVYVGLCPFHDDHDPSLQVNPEYQSFKCWVCDTGGDVIAFVQQREGVEFLEAIRMLAERAGIAWSGQKQRGSGKLPLYEAMAWAEGEFHRFLLKAPEAEPHRAYLQQRGISSESIARFHLGCHADEWEWLLGRARGTRFTPELLERLGLVVRRTGSPGYYDRFKGRVLFPIRDARGRPVAFGGRVLPDQQSDKTAKYLNSPETPLFHKSEQLYGLDVARQAIEKTRTAVLVEGYTDCVMAHQQGLGQTVATLGTALTADQVRLLRRHAGPTGKVVVVFDGDAAGRRAIDRSLELFVEQEVDLRLLRLPEGKDPCDLLLEEGGEAFAQRVDQAVDVIDFVMERSAEQFDLSTANGAYRAAESILDVLASTPPAATSSSPTKQLRREDSILGRLAHRFLVPEANLRKALVERRKAKRRRPARQIDTEKTVGESYPPFESELLEIVLHDPKLAEIVRREVALEEITHPSLRALLEKCFQLFGEGILPTYNNLTSVVEEPRLKSLATDLHEKTHSKGNVQERLDGVIDGLHKRRTTNERRSLNSKLRGDMVDEDREVALLEEIQRRPTSRVHPA